MRKSIRLSFFAALFLALVATAGAQQVTLSKAVQQFVKVDAPVVALTHVRVIDGTGAPAVDDQTIVIKDGKIESVGTAAPPAGADVLDMSGRTVIPGIVGMHDHLFYPNGQGWYPEMGVSFPLLYLGNGVTTIRTTGSVEPYSDLELKAKIDTGQFPGPHIFATGPYLEGPGSFTPQMHTLRGPADATETVNYWADEGITSYKAYMHITRAELKAAADAAHKRGLTITGHLCSVGFREAADAGIDDLEHGLVVDTEFLKTKQLDVCPTGADADLAKNVDINGPEVQGLIQYLVSKHVALTSTLPVFEDFVPNRAPLDPRILQAMSPHSAVAYLTNRARIGMNAKSYWPVLFQKEMDFERSFAKAGGLLLAGCDPTGIGGTLAGFGDQRELELLVQAGFTPIEAIRIATHNGAQFLHEDKVFGTIAPGMRADLVVIRGNPAEKISDIQNTEIVFKDGVGYDSQKLIDAARGLVGIR